VLDVKNNAFNHNKCFMATQLCKGTKTIQILCWCCCCCSQRNIKQRQMQTEGNTYRQSNTQTHIF